MIKNIKGKFVLFSKDGTKKLGTFDTKEEAQARGDEINKIKHANNQLLVNISTLVDNSAIRTETIEGVEFTVLPSKTLPPDIVMNGIMYPSDEVKRTIDTLDGTPVTLGHPVVNGKFADAYDMMSQAKHGVGGAFNRVKGQAQDGSWLVDKYIPTEALQNTSRGKIIANALAKKQPIHTSTGVYLSRIPELGTNALGQDYEFKANIDTFNHDAILVGEIGAATPEQGVGIFVNANGEQEVDVMYVNLSSGEDFSMSSNTLRQKLEIAAKEQELFDELMEEKENKYAYIEDYNEDTAIFYTCCGMYSVKYSISGEKVVFTGDIQKVESQRNYVFGGVIGKIVDIVKSVVKSTGQDEESAMPMNNHREGAKVEKQEVDKMIADALAVNAEQTAKLVQDAVTAALAANKTASEQAEKDALIQQVVNAKLLPEEAAKECGLQALKVMIANQKLPAASLNANRSANGADDEFAGYDLNSLVENK